MDSLVKLIFTPSLSVLFLCEHDNHIKQDIVRPRLLVEQEQCEDIPPSSCFFLSTTAPSSSPSLLGRESAATAVPSLVSPPSRLRERLCVLPHKQEEEEEEVYFTRGVRATVCV